MSSYGWVVTMGSHDEQPPHLSPPSCPPAGRVRAAEPPSALVLAHTNVLTCSDIRTPCPREPWYPFCDLWSSAEPRHAENVIGEALASSWHSSAGLERVWHSFVPSGGIRPSGFMSTVDTLTVAVCVIGEAMGGPRF